MKKSLSLLLALAMCLSLTAGCKPDTGSPDGAPSQTQASSAETSPTPEPAKPTPEPSPTPTPEPRPYAEEMGLVFSDTIDSYVPFYLFLTDSDGNYIPEEDWGEVRPIQQEASYTLGEIQKSEPDADGYVTLTIPYAIDMPIYLFYPSSDEKFPPCAVRWPSIRIFDYYTGLVLPAADVDLDGNGGFAYSTTLSYEGKDYEIFYSVESTAGTDSATLVNFLDNGCEERFFYHPANTTITARIPAEYDGLCLSLTKIGFHKYHELDETVDDSTIYHLLDPERTSEGESGPDDYTCVRVSDLIG